MKNNISFQESSGKGNKIETKHMLRFGDKKKNEMFLRLLHFNEMKCKEDVGCRGHDSDVAPRCQWHLM